MTTISLGEGRQPVPAEFQVDLIASEEFWFRVINCDSASLLVMCEQVCFQIGYLDGLHAKRFGVSLWGTNEEELPLLHIRCHSSIRQQLLNGHIMSSSLHMMQCMGNWCHMAFLPR